MTAMKLIQKEANPYFINASAKQSISEHSVATKPTFKLDDSLFTKSFPSPLCFFFQTTPCCAIMPYSSFSFLQC
jgi:hypothetical protein